MLLLASFLATGPLAGQNSASPDEEERPRTILSIAPLGIVNKFRFKGEFALTGWISAGSQVSVYFGLYPGYQVSPFLRLYLPGNAPDGFYLQPFMGYYRHRTPEITYTVGNNGEILQEVFRIKGVGFGAVIGYQYLAGRSKNWAIDFNMGYKSFPAGLNRAYNLTDFIWYTTGPGSPISATFQVGYAF